MALTLNDTPSAERTHIIFLGKMNSGKSTLMNAVAGQEISIVADVGGTTTDPVKKPMEIHGIGPCVLMDTAGFDDEGELGKKRLEKTREAVEMADLAVVVCSSLEPRLDFSKERHWLELLRKKDTPTVVVLNKVDKLADVRKAVKKIEGQLQAEVLCVSALTGENIGLLIKKMVDLKAEKGTERFITGGLLQEEDLVLLVMPQDIQAPKGRLILPQVQTIRELLDKKCLVMCVATDKLEQALASLKIPPKLIITDSQAYKTVYDKKPGESRLTSFSTLFAAYKGDLGYYVAGAKKIEELTEEDHVLIAECCTHAPLDEDIGRVKLPRLLRKKVGQGLKVDLVSGTDFPDDLSGYQLVIQCGACMFGRKYVMSRIDKAREQGIPMTNYGVAIAQLNGILEEVELSDGMNGTMDIVEHFNTERKINKCIM